MVTTFPIDIVISSKMVVIKLNVLNNVIEILKIYIHMIILVTSLKYY